MSKLKLNEMNMQIIESYEHFLVNNLDCGGRKSRHMLIWQEQKVSPSAPLPPNFHKKKRPLSTMAIGTPTNSMGTVKEYAHIINMYSSFGPTLLINHDLVEPLCQHWFLYMGLDI